MKTPQEVATEIMDAFNQYPDPTVISLMVSAIKADRAQREDHEYE